MRATRLLPLLPLLLPLLTGCGDQAQRTAVPGRGRDAFAAIAGRDEIEIVSSEPRFPVSSTYGAISGRAASDVEVGRYSPLFVREFSLYPPSLIHRCQLKRVVLCKDLAFDGQLRGAIPDFEHDTLYLDVLRGGYDPRYLRKVLHHEFFHIVDYRDDGQLYEDREWGTLNPPGFKYGTGGKHAQDAANACVLTDKFPGFLDYYGTTGVEEDKAELFANMIVDAAYVTERAKTDRVLRVKVQALKKLLARFCPEVDDAFWTAAAALDRKN